MKKRLAIILPVVLLLLLATMGYFLQRGRQMVLADPYKTVSGKACFIIETRDLRSFLNSLTTGKGIFGEILNVGELSDFSKKLKYITDRLNEPAFEKLAAESPSLISFYPEHSGGLKTLLSIALPGHIRERNVIQMMAGSGIKPVIKLSLDGRSVFYIPYNNSNDTAWISLESGILLLSNSGKVLTGALIQSGQQTDVRNLPGFSRVLMASGKNEDKLFIVFSNLKDLISPALNPGRSFLADRITKIAEAGGGDIYLNEDGIVLSGYTETTDTSEYLYKYKSLKPGEFKTCKILPQSTGMFETIRIQVENISDRSEFPVSERVYNLASAIRQYVGDEITRAYIDIRERPVSENSLIIYKLNEPVQAEQVFIRELAADREIAWFEPDEQIKIPVYKTPFAGLINAFIPGFAAGTDDSWIAFYDNYMITGSSFVTISRLLYDNLLNNTLAYDLNYRDFESSLPSRAAYFLFMVPSRMVPFLADFLDEDLVKFLKKNISSVNKIQSAGYQLAASNEMIYNSLSVRFRAEASEESKTEWETLLDSTAAIKPFFFVNHITGAKEIFVQDVKNNTYLINAAGRVLWKVPLSERILGNIYMIDYFHNGKYQLLFAGKSYLHLIDRNGNYVERFPVKLRSPATNSLALFDYDNNQNYRLLIAGEDRYIYAYEKTGSVVKGWKPFRTLSNVTARMSHFQSSGKDYLVASDENTIYLLDRSGNRRVALKEPVKKAANSAIRLGSGAEPYLICTAGDGTVQQIFFDGNIKKFSLGKYSDGHSFDIFDIDGDAMDEFIIIDKGVLHLFDHNRNELFSKDFKTSRLEGPINFVFSNSDKKIGVFDADKNQIFLIDKYGEVTEGFPLKGASMFSIGKLSEKNSWHLIVGGTDRFLYNYRIGTN